MKSFLIKFLLRIAFKAATDKKMRKAVSNAVMIQNCSDKSGDDKMKGALEAVEKQAPDAFKRAAKSEVKMLIEAKLNDLI